MLVVQYSKFMSPLEMRVQCSTCLELLTPSDDLTCTPCGHVFHMACVIQWFENKKNCPQVRPDLILSIVFRDRFDFDSLYKVPSSSEREHIEEDLLG